MNRWIQGIMLFDFVLKHVPGSTHLAADALSRRSLGEGEEIEEEDDGWLDDIALHITTLSKTGETPTQSTPLQKFSYNSDSLPSYNFVATVRLDKN